MSDVALLILFNHNYEANLDRLKTIYAGRFEDIYFIMPFYTGSRKDVISVHGNSYYFQGYVAKALDQLKHLDYEHYAVVGDDLMLNPAINQNNYKDYFKVDEKTAFIPGIFLLNDLKEGRPNRKYPPYWPWNERILQFSTRVDGVEVEKFLPSKEEAAARLRQHGFNFTSRMPWEIFYGRSARKYLFEQKRWWKTLKYFVRNTASINKDLAYPLVGSYSDIVIIPRGCVNQMIQYCGVFTALELFVEVALPTALALSADSISQETNERRGETYWNDDIGKLETKYHNTLNELMNGFHPQSLYIHPVKLSRWK
ncbi:MAG: hypothetical protein H7Y03_13480 [Chitinophagaceae bacterium]|nr:hypothetical protein [Chitinophagaceae bacterium]